MFYTMAIVGRPNVGKSTLFNILLNDNRRAIVANLSGLTRDRQYADLALGDQHYLLIDTPGIGAEETGMDRLCTQQTQIAIQESDGVLFMVDARAGLLASEKELAHTIRALQKPVILIINKIDGLDERAVCNDFYELGIEIMLPMAASHRRGLGHLQDLLIKHCIHPDTTLLKDLEKDSKSITTVSIIGRPNVGKSTLLNRLLGEERVVASEIAGTTRDSIAADFYYEDQQYRLVDTAGIRRKSKVAAGVEKFSVFKSLGALQVADFAFVLIDAQEDLVDQDLHLLELVAKSGVAILLVVNKWDGLDPYHKEQIKQKLKRKLNFVDYAPIHFISAYYGSGVGLLFKTVQKIQSNLYQDHSSNQLTQILEEAVNYYPPPLHNGRRIKLRYAHLGGHKPFTIVIHGNQTQALNQNYKSYLTKQFRKALGTLEGIPIRILFKTGDNPYQNKKNQLTGRQLQKRRRLLKHVKRK